MMFHARSTAIVIAESIKINDGIHQLFLNPFYFQSLNPMPRNINRSIILGWKLEYMESRKTLTELFHSICQLEIEEAFVLEVPLAPGVTTFIVYVKLVHGTTRNLTQDYFKIDGEIPIAQPARSWRCCSPYIEVGGRYFTYNIHLSKVMKKKRKREESEEIHEVDYISSESKKEIDDYIVDYKLEKNIQP